WVVKRRKSRVRSGKRGNKGRESRVSHREKARLPPPLRACNSPKVTTSLGQRWASGCLGMVRSCSSTSENNAVINSTVIIRRSSPGKDVTESSVEESSDDCKSKNLYH